MKKNTRLRVIMIGPCTETHGGMSTVVNQLLNSSLKDQFEIRYIATNCVGSKFHKIVYAIYAYFIYLYCIIKTHSHIIHIHSASRESFYRKSFFLVTARLFSKRVVFHLHGGAFMVFYAKESGRIKQKLIRYILQKTDVIIVLSTSWRKNIQSILPDKTIEVLPNFIKIHDFSKRNYRTANSPPTILFLGRVRQKKGFPDLMAAAEILKNKKIQIRCVICGDGDLEYWKKQCANRGLSNEFVFKGWIDKSLKHELLSKSDIFVLPSYYEGMPMSVLEAMSYGIPVIATNVGGTPEIISDGVNGYMIEPGDVQSLAYKLEKLLADNVLKETIGARGRKTIADKFDISKSVESLKTIYYKLPGV